MRLKPRMTFSAGWLLDGRGGAALRRVRIQVEGGEIRSIEADRSAPETAGVERDFSSCTVVPALCDGHVHLSMSGVEDAAARKAQLSAPFEEAKDTIEKNVEAHLARGIVAVRDGGDRSAHTLRYKRSRIFESGPFTVFSSGRAWHASGRYGAMIGQATDSSRSLAESIRDSERGDLVKIINSGPNSLSEFGKETAPQFSLQDLRGAVAFSHARGLKVMVHANGSRPVREALEAGCDSIEHGYFMGADNLRRMAERGIPWIPTVHAMEVLRSARKGTPEGEVAARNVEHQLNLIRLSREYGVVVALGTDSGGFGVHHGEAVIEELGLFISAGMSLEEAVKCAASTAFDLLGLKGLGRLAPGSKASFVVARGGPERLPESLRYPEAVLVDGVTI